MNVDAALERMMDEEFAGATHDSDGDDDYLDAVEEATFSSGGARRRQEDGGARQGEGSLAERLAAKHNIKVTGARGPPRRRRRRAGRATSTAPAPAPRPRASPPRLDRTTRRRRRRPPSPRARVAAARPSRRQASRGGAALDSQPAVAARIGGADGAAV